MGNRVSRNRECSVCYVNYSIIKKISSVCGHDDVCPDCIENLIETELNSKGINVEVRCPNSGCPIKLTYDDVKRLASKELFNRYDTLLLRAAIRKLPNFRWCKAPNCGSGQEHTTGDLFPIITCKACGAKSCFSHDVPWHTGLSCEQFTEKLTSDDNTANRAYVERHTKPCPECKISIEKDGGCDHITCRACGYEFCWLCLSEFKKILRHGNHEHRPTCQYYARFDARNNDDDDFDLL